MTFKRASRVARISASASAMTSQRARELRAEGVDIVALSSGEPDFQTPPHIVEAAHRAMVEGQTKYTTISGTDALKAAVIEKFKRDNGIDYARSEVMISTGSKQVIFNALMATVEPGDEVIIPAPFFIAYEQTVDFADGRAVIVPCSQANAFKLMPEQLESAITPSTRWLILNAPTNPSGAVYSADDLRGLAEVLRRHPHVWTLCDDIYEKILFDGAKFHTLVEVAPDLKERTLTVNGVSKTYAMTGFRVGYCGGPADLLKEMVKVQSQATSGPSSVGQAAALAALNGPQDFIETCRQAYQDRRDLVLSMLNQTQGLRCTRPEGAFYVFPKCEGVIGRRMPDGRTIETDRDFVLYLMDQFHVATVHGAAYGLSPYFRISIAASSDDLRRGCERIQEAVGSLK